MSFRQVDPHSQDGVESPFSVGPFLLLTWLCSCEGRKEDENTKTVSHRHSEKELLGQRAAMEKQRQVAYCRVRVVRRGGAVVSRCPAQAVPTPHHSSPKARCRPRDWLRQWSLARLLVQRQEGQLREGGFQPKHSTVQVNAALPWGPKMCGHLLASSDLLPSFCLPLLPCPCPFRKGPHFPHFPFGDN